MTSQNNPYGEKGDDPFRKQPSSQPPNAPAPEPTQPWGSPTYNQPPPAYGQYAPNPPAYGQPAPYGQQQPNPYAPPTAPYGQPVPYGQPTPYGQPPYGYGGYGQPNRGTNGLAIASMVLGILWLWWVGSILALIFGYIARSQIRQSQQGGGGMAIAGIVLGWIGVALLIVGIIGASVS